MRGPRTVAIIALGFFTCALVGCGKKAAPTGDEPSAAATPTPIKPAPAPVQPDDGTVPQNKGLFPIGILPMDPVKVEPPKVNPEPMMPTITLPKDPLPKVDDKKDPPKGPPMPMVVTPPPDPKLPPPKIDDKKDPVKQGSVIIWPTDIGGKDVKGYIKDTSDPDPAIRVIALKTLPSFGPTVRKATTPDGKITYGKALLARMSAATESDPWVRLAAFELVLLVGFEEDLDIREAVRLLGLIAQDSVTLRGDAVRTLAAFGNRGEPSVQYLVGGPALSDPSYETRRSIAATLGMIGINEKTGPNADALKCLTTVLINDKSVAVRLEAMQSLVLLGPPHHKVMVPDPMDKTKMIEVQVPDQTAAKKYLDAVKKRLAPYAPRPGEPKTNDTGVAEPNKQVEIWARVVLMRFDPADEVKPDNLDAITKYLKGNDYAAKIQALFVLGLLGEFGARRIDDVVKQLASDDPTIVYAAARALAQMGAAAKPAIPELEKLRTRGKDADEKKYYNMLADEAIKVIKDPPKAPDPKEKK